ncbi:Na+/H+ antiporter NhaC family protein [Anaeromicrobium sediminis]|uniref:Sodium:proton exchanger n=1 Tax=Anaeromicrobium sediminis TaxID=1478221 RepID=A0A267MEJ2_9FIRM|nr:Na+/H+ antiporter NhaC family protein [Anaeromicrobium sediminis]PAB57979.1 sodium:proton exchanger [Anaeromicrobium sediminis]
MEHMGFLSLIPPLLAIIVSILTKNVIVSLFLGSFVGILIMSNGMVITATQTIIGDYFFKQLTDSYNAGVLVLLVFIGGFVALMEKSGGSAAFAEKAAKFINTRVKTQLAAWIGGIIVFFSDLGTPLIVGPIFEPIFDKGKVSREKLAWIIDSTASPVAVLVPFIGWGVYVMGLIQKEFESLNIMESDWSAFVHAIPFQFYPILTILMVPLVAFTGLEFGAMAKAEKRVREIGELFWYNSKPMRKSENMKEIQNIKSSAMLVWLPILVLLVTLFGLLIPHGFPFKKVSGSVFRVALSTGYLFAGILLIIMMKYYKVKKLQEAFEVYIYGMQKMMYVAITLVLAWSLGNVIKNMGTANYIIEIMDGTVPSYFVPILIFIVGGCMSFATGSSWGTFAVMIPLAIPMSHHLGAPLYACIGAVLSGGLFGDHCSPISDTTILASTGAGCDHIDHVKTQLPYAIVNAVAALIAYIMAGITGSASTLMIAIVIMIISVVVISKLQRKNKANRKSDKDQMA